MRTLIILLVAVAAMALVTACPKGLKILGPSGPTQPGVYFNRNWQQPIKLVNPLETKIEKKPWSNQYGTGVYENTVLDIEATFQLHSGDVIHPGSGEFELDVYPGSPMYGMVGGMDARSKACYENNKASDGSIKVLYIGDFDLGSKNDPRPVSKFSVFLTSRGRYLIEVEGEGRILIEW